MKVGIRIWNVLIALSLVFSALAITAPAEPVEAAFEIGVPLGNTINACGGLFFSEYIEGTSYNKAIEIYNGTGVPVDLSLYKIQLYSNGGTTPSERTLSGTLAHGDVYVIAHGSANAAILAVADITDNVIANDYASNFL